ncbi:MAG: hypothetical protein QM760_11140 [Nibricoccus sp.]
MSLLCIRAHRPTQYASVRPHGTADDSSVYLSERPFAFSTGYFLAFAAIFASITAATSIPEMLANSSA